MADLREICRFANPVRDWPIMAADGGSIQTAAVTGLHLSDTDIRWFLHPYLSGWNRFPYDYRHATDLRARGPLAGALPAGTVLSFNGNTVATLEAAPAAQAARNVLDGAKATGLARPRGDGKYHRLTFPPGSNPTLADHWESARIVAERIDSIQLFGPAELREHGNAVEIRIPANVERISAAGLVDYIGLAIMEISVSSVIGDSVPEQCRRFPARQSVTMGYHPHAPGCIQYGPIDNFRSIWCRHLESDRDESLVETGRTFQRTGDQFVEVESEVLLRERWETVAHSGVGPNSVFVTPDGKLWNVQAVETLRDERDRIMVEIVRRERGQPARPDLADTDFSPLRDRA